MFRYSYTTDYFIHNIISILYTFSKGKQRTVYLPNRDAQTTTDFISVRFLCPFFLFTLSCSWLFLFIFCLLRYGRENCDVIETTKRVLGVFRACASACAGNAFRKFESGMFAICEQGKLDFVAHLRLSTWTVMAMWSLCLSMYIHFLLLEHTRLSLCLCVCVCGKKLYYYLIK